MALVIFKYLACLLLIQHLKCHPELAAKQGESESRSFMPLPGDSGSIKITVEAITPPLYIF